MTHNDIYTKFMIEYDKANVTSSYPSLTKYEAATLLDRAYLALISRKLTGNNTRRVPFEYDTKAIEDLRPLVTTKRFKKKDGSNIVLNEYKFGMPDDLLYYIEGVANYGSEREIVLPVNHQIARKFKLTNSNFPWVNHPVSYIEGSEVYVLIDPFIHASSPDLDGTYIKKPASFVESLKKIEDGGNNGENDDNGGGNNDGGNSGGDDPITVTPPTITPESLTFTNSLLVTITATLADRIIYLINGGTWYNHEGTTKEILITESSTVRAYVVLNNVSSERVTKVYTKQLNQDPQEYSASVSISECYYQDGSFHITYTVSKENYDLHVYKKRISITNRYELREISVTQVDLFNVPYQLDVTNDIDISGDPDKIFIYVDILNDEGLYVNGDKKKITNLPTNSPEAPDPEDDFGDTQYVSFAPQSEEETSNNLGEAMLGEIILQ